MAGVERKERTRKKMESQAKRTAECAPLVVSKAAGAYLPLPPPFLTPPPPHVSLSHLPDQINQHLH